MTSLGGRAYGSRATLEITGEALTWRARRGDVRENIATTTYDVRAARVSVGRISVAGLALGALAGAWMASESVAQGAVLLGGAVALLGWRAIAPRRRLCLALADRELVLAIDPASVADARALVAQIARDRGSHDASRPIALP